MNEKIVKVNASNGLYDIIIGRNIILDAGKQVKKLGYDKCAIICDHNVEKLYLERLAKSIRSAGINVSTITMPSGEEYKNNETLIKLYSRLYEENVDRKSVVIALGGGVVGDIAGFAAASFLRGVDFIQIPTTLLAQVDSSVGGKVAIDLPEGKNLVGAFYQPKAVLIDVELLLTLDDRQFACGMAEALKYGFILDSSVLNILPKDKNDGETLIKLVARCCELKAEVVERDPLDKGDRMLLNFGHTFGHAIEKVEGYGKILHGEAISIGMLMAAKWGIKLAITPNDVYKKIKSVLERYSLPTTYTSGDSDKLFEAMSGDKKGESTSINIVLLDDIGKSRYIAIDRAEFGRLFTKIGSNV